MVKQATEELTSCPRTGAHGARTDDGYELVELSQSVAPALRSLPAVTE